MSNCEEIEKINKGSGQIIKWSEWENSEKTALCLLQEMGYKYMSRKELNPDVQNPERLSLREVILKQRFIKKIKEFNPWIDDNNIRQIIKVLTIPAGKSILDFNKELWEYLTKPHTLTVEQDLDDGRGRCAHFVTLINWVEPKKNDFVCTNQFKVNASKGNRIPDVVVFVNGLPLVVIECKSPLINNPLTEGIGQIMQYEEIIPRIFHLNQIIIITSGQSARYGVVGNSYEHYREWKEPYPIKIADLSDIIKRTGRKTTEPTPQDILIYGMLEPTNLLDLIRNFVVYETSRGKLIKKIARYQQFRAVNQTIKRIHDGKEWGGTIWHTQGSGKSLTMLFTAIKLRRDSSLNNPLLVFISDRIDLVGQLNATFKACGFSNPVIPKKKSETIKDPTGIKPDKKVTLSKFDHLLKLIKMGQGSTIFTTSQMFHDLNKGKKSSKKSIKNKKVEKIKFPVLNEDKNIFVLIDEAHRSEYKKNAMRMRKSMPNAFYIAYTGTPLARNEKKQLISVGKGKTVRKFGSFIDVYNIRQSVEDGATLQIFYENRLPDMHIEGSTIDTIFDRVFTDKTEEQKEEIKKKYANKDAVLAAEERIKEVVLDIIEHFEKCINPNCFKAQIVVNTRELAVKYKKYLDEFQAPESVVIISANSKKDDELKKLGVSFITDKNEQNDFTERFKDPDDPLKILIVCDMLITGFDAPIEQVMYLDKSLREHNLLQAIARVNRTYENKTHGLIVDYYGISVKLDEALKIFDTSDVEGVLLPIGSELPKLKQYHKKVMEYLDGYDRDDLEGIVLKILPEDIRAKFYADFKIFTQTLDMILPNPEAEPYLDDLKLLHNVVKALRNRTRDEQLDIRGCGGKVKQLIDEYVRSSGITQLVEPVPILSEKFQESLDKLKSPASKASEIEHAVKKEISVKVDEDPVFYMSLKEKLEEIIEMYTQERINLAEKIKQLKALVVELKSRPDTAKILGLNPSELAFFNTMKQDFIEIGVKDDRQIVKNTYEILEEIEPYVNIVDWQRKSDVQRIMLKNIMNNCLNKTDIPEKRKLSLAREIINLAITHYSY